MKKPLCCLWSADWHFANDSI